MPEALPDAPSGDHVNKVLDGGVGLQLGHFFVVEVLDDFNRCVSLPRERSCAGLVQISAFGDWCYGRDHAAGFYACRTAHRMSLKSKAACSSV